MSKGYGASSALGTLETSTVHTAKCRSSLWNDPVVGKMGGNAWSGPSKVRSEKVS